MPKIYACIWSNDKAAEMAKFYKSIFKGTKLGKTSYWGKNQRWVENRSIEPTNLYRSDLLSTDLKTGKTSSLEKSRNKQIFHVAASESAVVVDAVGDDGLKRPRLRRVK